MVAGCRWKQTRAGSYAIISPLGSAQDKPARTVELAPGAPNIDRTRMWLTDGVEILRSSMRWRMRILGPVSEDEVLQCSVRAERDSERYGETVRKLERRVGDNPRAVLSAYRSWPDHCLINWDWWLRLTNGTRRPRDAALNQEPDPGDEVIARAASTNPELIAVRVPGSCLVLLEGHVRLTAYATFPEQLPDELELYLGESPRMAEWSEY